MSLKDSLARHAWVPIATALTALFLVLFSWSASSPIGSSPDDDYHMASIWCGQGFRDGLCEPGTTATTVKVPEALITNSSCYAFHAEHSGDCPQSTSLIETARSNSDHGYPPVYYWAMSFFAGPDVNASVLMMRAVNSLVFVGAMAAMVWLLPRRLKGLPVVGVLLTSMPLGIFLIASVNPSGWAYSMVAFFFSAFVAFLADPESRRRWGFLAAAAASIVLGAGARADAAVYIVLAMVAAWIVLFDRSRITRTNIIVTAALTGAAFAFYKLAGQGAVITRQSAEGIDFGNLAANIVNLPSLWAGCFGTWGLGWLDTAMPTGVWFVTLGVFLGAIFLALHNAGRLKLAAMSLVAFALVAVPLFVLTKENIPVGANVQPRYLLPLLALLVIVAVIPSPTTSAVRFSSAQFALIGFALLAANSVALQVNLRRYVTGIDVHSVNLDSGIEWWWSNFPLSPNGVWILGSLSMAVLLVSLYAMRDRLGPRVL